ncbi:MAG: zinc-ribbon domain-containing protein [Candidatus Eisenbacteria bacterium]
MPVTCPHCSTRYTLPEALLGPGGARVRCPRCREPFAVGPDGGEVGVLSASALSAPLLPAPALAGPTPVSAAHGAAPSSANDAAQPAIHDAGTTAERAGPPVLPSAGSLAAPRRIDGAVHSSAAELDPKPASPLQAAREAAALRAPDGGSPEDIARAVLDELDSHSGEAIAASRAEGRLFREFGAVIAEAFEFYRRRVGSHADPAPFRAALRDRWGVDLDPGQPPARLG